MADFKTPGVYIQEISTLPASVAPVATAIPAFVGYTEKSENSGNPIPANTPTRITSLLEYQEMFGGAFDEQYSVLIEDPAPGDTDPVITINTPTTLSPYLLYYQVQMYFANGGGPCYIVSVGAYVDDGPGPSDIVVADLQAGISALEEEDEPTILVVPEAILLGASERQTINDDLLTQCNKLQDRFAVMDAIVIGGTVAADATAFRDDVGTSNLKYGASYYPSLITTIDRFYTEGSVVITDDRGGSGNGPYHDCTLDIIANGDGFAIGKIVITNTTNIGNDSFDIDTDTFTEGSPEFGQGDTNIATATNLMNAITAAANPNYTATRTSNVILIKATEEGNPGLLNFDYTDSGTGIAATVTGSGTLEIIAADKTLHARIKAKLKEAMVLYPCGAMAGVYARVDRNRGVWKAPANVSINNVVEPSVLVTHEEQAGLNIDATSGKSINAIRYFSGKGNIVWGARTLAGNDNEWRYVPVRRLYIFIEESVKKATEFVVFEPNDANTWLRVKTMIENFLSSLWRDGALAGAKPEDAFFVKVGLGQTMTALDILEGRMNIEIGLAAVRPAEFIILKFSHKLQES